MLDTRTKHTVAKDRLIVAEQRLVDVERRKSSSHLQLITYEQKQLEKRLSSLQNLEHSSKLRHRSISEANLHLNEMIQLKFPSSQNLLSIPQMDDFQRRFSASSDGDWSENDGEDNNSKFIYPPIVAIIAPEEDRLFLVQ